MPEKVMVTKGKLDSLAEAVGSKSGLGVPLTIEGMEDAVLGIETGIQPTGSIVIRQNGTHDVTKYAEANVNVRPKLQNKTVDPSTELQYIVADSGYDGLNEVAVDAISSDYIIPDGTIDITDEGYFDVYTYATAYVRTLNYSQIKTVTPTNATQYIVPDQTVLYRFEFSTDILTATIDTEQLERGRFIEFYGSFKRRPSILLRRRWDPDTGVNASGRVDSTSKWYYDIGLNADGAFHVWLTNSEGVTSDSPNTVVVRYINYDYLSQVIVEPIPSNYGLITWDGSVLTVS